MTEERVEKSRSRWRFWVTALMLTVGGISLVRSTVGQGTDFLVFWKTGRALLDGVPFYDLAREGGMVFKYPPWLAPFFALFSFTSFEKAKWVWGTFSVACLFGVFFLMETRLKVARKAWAPVALLFWGLWAVHALDGQVSVPLLFLGLWLVTSNTKFDFLVDVFYPAKIFTVFPTFTLRERFFNLRTLLISAILVITLSILVCLRSFGGNPQKMFLAWMQAASSGAEYLNAGQTRGPKNQSLTAYVCRIFNVAPQDTRTEVAMALSFFFIAAMAIQRWMKRSPAIEKWMVALALTPVFHPLPWEHLYVWCFPLAAYALNDRLKEKEAIAGIEYFTSLFLLTMSNSHTIPVVGRALESQVGRAWGALFLSISFINNRCRRESRNAHS